MSAPFPIDATIKVRGRERVFGLVMVAEMNAYPGHALIVFPTGERELIAHELLESPPDGAAARAQHERGHAPQED